MTKSTRGKITTKRNSYLTNLCRSWLMRKHPNEYAALRAVAYHVFPKVITKEDRARRKLFDSIKP
jgi:hypothetical protein